MSKVFILSRSYYEESTNYYLMGPDDVSEEQFSNLCYSLLDDAAKLALSASRHSDREGRIYASDVVELLVPLLEKRGYQLFNPPKVSFFASPLDPKAPFIRNFSASVSNEIINYNRKFDRKNRESK